MHIPFLGVGALALSALSAILIIGFLIRRPPLTTNTKLGLGVAMFILPSGVALLGNVHNMQTTMHVEFCNSCHVMHSFVNDARNAESPSLAALHAKLEVFKDDACYNCHADYGMYGGVTTKIGGMHHVLAFYGDDWAQPGHRPPKMFKPYDTRRCTSCHDPLRAGAPLEHRIHADKIKSREVSCTSKGCHGPPHPAWVQETGQ